MMTFDSPGAFAAHLRKIAAEMPVVERKVIHDAGLHVQEEAQSYIGHYQQQAGPFPAWAPLAPSTLYGFDDLHGHHPGKEEMGYAPPDNPLLRTAELMHAIELAYRGLSFVVGVPSETVGTGTPEDPVRDVGDVAKDLEFGTREMPARSFLGRALYVLAPHIVHAIGVAVSRALAGLPYVPPELRTTSEDVPF